MPHTQNEEDRQVAALAHIEYYAITTNSKAVGPGQVAIERLGEFKRAIGLAVLIDLPQNSTGGLAVKSLKATDGSRRILNSVPHGLG